MPCDGHSKPEGSRPKGMDGVCKVCTDACLSLARDCIPDIVVRACPCDEVFFIPNF